jgi:hypothetical protein
MPNVKARRVATVVAAPLAALAAWALLRAAGANFHVSTGDGRVDAGDVAFAATAAAVLGWVVARTLQNRVQRPRLWWARIGSSCCAASMVGPSWLADDVNSVALMALHIVTATVILVGFAATLPVRRRRAEYAAGPGASSPTH